MKQPNRKRKLIMDSKEHLDQDRCLEQAEEEKKPRNGTTSLNHVPSAAAQEAWSWERYLKEQKAIAAPVELFSKDQSFPEHENGFQIGMRLEGIDPRHPSVFCVLSVAEVCGYRLRLHFDGYLSCYDFWTNAGSPDIHPVGWCEKTKHKLHIPKGYPDPENFSWTEYLEATQTNAVPDKVFKMVHFDGWDHKYDYWVEADSPDLHPVRWCDVTGHPLEVPQRANDVKILPGQAVCPTPGCRGIGHIRGPRYSGHHRLVQQAKCLKIKGKEDIDLDNLFREYSAGQTQQALHQSVFMSAVSARPFRDLPLGREQHCKLLPGVADIQASQVARWTVDEVAEFVQSLLGCDEHAKCFKKEQIDGKAFLLLTQTDIVKVMKIKLGPALKIYNSILMFRNSQDLTEEDLVSGQEVRG
uniref:SAM domain-containing protein n=1 Tax=Propithecus coquereli TaxID=379532 RepID=A0A2K6GLU4_PROCO